MIFAVVPPEQLSALAAWLPRQRWFGGKGAPITSIGLGDQAELGAGGSILLVDVSSPRGTRALGALGPAPSNSQPPAAACRCPEPSGHPLPGIKATALSDQRERPESGVEYPPARYLLTPGDTAPEGLDQAAVRQRWFELLASSAVLAGRHGAFAFEPCAPLEGAASSRLLGAEQSNTSILYSDAKGPPRWLLKLFRRVQPGENPDFELPRVLAAHTSFRNVPAALGRVVYRGESGEATTLACLSEFIPNQGDGWDYALRRLRANEGESLLADLALLGRRTAELHLALASIAFDPAFAPEPITATDVKAWRTRALSGVEAEALRPYEATLAPWRQLLREGAAGLEACHGLAKIRIHGDYHLGQVLRTEDDFYLFDFEGEPARPLAERRRKGCALQDVAGMLRSLSYAAHTAQSPAWEAPARQAFLDAYRAAIAAAPVPLVPADEPGFAAALRFWEIEKAVYELRYELAHRPDWVQVPLAGLAALLSPTS